MVVIQIAVVVMEKSRSKKYLERRLDMVRDWSRG